MDWQELGMTAVRGVVVYALMLVVIRLLGKRTVGNFTAFDFLVALMLGEVVDEIIYGDVQMAQGIVAILVIAGAKYATAWLDYFDHGLNKILEGKPREIIHNGELVRDGMRSELVNEKEVMAALRLHGISDMREVRRAFMEVDGEISVIKHDWADVLRKGDIGGEHKKAREEHAAGEPPTDKQTDSATALGHE